MFALYREQEALSTARMACQCFQDLLYSVEGLRDVCAAGHVAMRLNSCSGLHTMAQCNGHASWQAFAVQGMSEPEGLE